MEWRALAAGLPDFATAFLFLATWIRPAWLGRDWVRHGVLMMLVEFLVIHAFGFLFVAGHEADAEGPGATLAVLGLGALYLLFAVAFGFAFKSWWPVFTIGWLIGSKLWSLHLASDDGTERGMAVLVWGVSTAAYFGGIFLTALLPLPRFGVRGSLHDYGMKGAARGAWVDSPHRALAFGFLYFLTVGAARTWFAQLHATATAAA
jgi:hypothetical protein